MFLSFYNVIYGFLFNNINNECNVFLYNCSIDIRNLVKYNKSDDNIKNLEYSKFYNKLLLENNKLKEKILLQKHKLKEVKNNISLHNKFIKRLIGRDPNTFIYVFQDGVLNSCLRSSNIDNEFIINKNAYYGVFGHMEDNVLYFDKPIKYIVYRDDVFYGYKIFIIKPEKKSNCVRYIILDKDTEYETIKPIVKNIISNTRVLYKNEQNINNKIIFYNFIYKNYKNIKYLKDILYSNDHKVL